MRLPELSQTLGYAREKIKQATGYQAYLDTFDRLDKAPPLISSIAGGVIGAASLAFPSSIRLWKEMYNSNVSYRGFLISGVCALTDNIIGCQAPIYLPFVGFALLPQETQQSFAQLPREISVSLIGGVLTASKLLANSFIHAGMDALQRKTSLLKI